MKHKLILYFFWSCPFCQYVLQFMDENNIQIETRDIRAEPKYREELMTIGGKTQVPCLIIDGKPLYESADIIDWLKKNALGN